MTQGSACQEATSRAVERPSQQPIENLPIVEEIRPVPDPFEVCRSLAGSPHLLFLDSAEQHASRGRYSYVTADPFEWISMRVARGERPEGGGGADPVTVLSEKLGRFRLPRLPDLPPFQGGAAGLFGYDLCHEIEDLPWPEHDEFQAPDLAVGLYDVVVAFDHVLNRAWIVSTGFPETDPGRRMRRAERRLAQFRARLLECPAEAPLLSNGKPIALSPQFMVDRSSQLTSNFSRPAYLEAVGRVIDYIHDGDCFQVNLSQRLMAPAPARPLELYARLRNRNAASFSAYFDLGDFVLASASPERFLMVQQGQVITRPIKGTRPRGLGPAEDAYQVRDLLASAKDRAENVMIVDLLRNDLGRVCSYGSIEAPAVCQLESLAYVHHLVSEIRGRLRPGLGPIDLLRAAFPGGSVTGAPKIRAMEIIAELEPTARGPYCGSLGYLGFSGESDTSILIRTFTIGKGWCQFPVGGGIVADSDPRREYDETWHKAEGLLRALE